MVFRMLFSLPGKYILECLSPGSGCAQVHGALLVHILGKLFFFFHKQTSVWRPKPGMAFQNGKVCSIDVPEAVFRYQKVRIGRHIFERPLILFSAF